MKLAVVGSRRFSDYERMKQELDRMPNVTEIISGGAAGTDLLAQRWARENERKMTTFLPYWKLHGRAAGMIRNKLIIDAADAVIAFWDGKSHGTADSIRKAKRAGKPLTIIYF